MKTDSEISTYLQKQRRLFVHDGPERELYVTYGTGYYGHSSTAMIEVEGSPIKGLAIVVATAPFEDVAADECEVWVLQTGNRMRHLPHRSREATAIASRAIARKVAAQESE